MGGAVFPSCWLFGLRCRVPALKPTGCWAGLGFGGGSGGLQEGSCQWVLTRASSASVFVSTVSHNNHPPPHLHRRPCNTSWWVWPSLLWGQFFWRILVHTIPCGHPLTVEFLFSPILWISWDQTLLPSKPDSLGALPSVTRVPGWEAWCGAQDFHSCGRTSVV